MKTIRELRNFDLQPSEITSNIKYLIKQNVDFDVYLPTRLRNLQRAFVWTIEQKRALIESIFIGRHIPHCAIINIINPDDNSKDILQVIDGKQRLSTIFDFYLNKFSVVINGNEFYYIDLPSDYQLAVSGYYVRYYVVNEPWEHRITDQQKIDWYKFINFAGTPQDKEYLENLK